MSCRVRNHMHTWHSAGSSRCLQWGPCGFHLSESAHPQSPWCPSHQEARQEEVSHLHSVEITLWPQTLGVNFTSSSTRSSQPQALLWADTWLSLLSTWPWITEGRQMYSWAWWCIPNPSQHSGKLREEDRKLILSLGNVVIWGDH